MSFSLGVKAEESIVDFFHLSLKPTLGVGVLPMSDKSSLYGSLKLFPFNYGEEEIGIRFLGVGVSIISSSGAFSFSPHGFTY